MKRATSPRPAEAAASAPTFADVARLVAGSAAPTWLAEDFEQWAPSLKVDRHVAKKQPKRTVMKKRLAYFCFLLMGTMARRLAAIACADVVR
jgi:hypothetical protein